MRIRTHINNTPHRGLGLNILLIAPTAPLVRCLKISIVTGRSVALQARAWTPDQ